MRSDLYEAMLRAVQPPPKDRLELLDSAVSGLALPLTAARVATSTVRTRLPDSQTSPTDFWQVARERHLGSAETGEGADWPNHQWHRFDRTKAKARRTREPAPVLPTVAERLTECQAARQGDWWLRYRGEVARLVDKLIIPKLGQRALVETACDDWTGLIAAVRKRTPATASWLYATVSSFPGHAEAHGWAGGNMLLRRGKGLTAPHATPRSRVTLKRRLDRISNVMKWHWHDLRRSARVLSITRPSFVSSSQQVCTRSGMGAVGTSN
jgi:hypothetical protein